MKTPKKTGESPKQKLHALSGGHVKKMGTPGKNKKLSLKNPQQALDALEDKTKFTLVSKTPTKQLNGFGAKTPKTGEKGKQGKKSLQEGAKTPVNVSKPSPQGSKKKNRRKSEGGAIPTTTVTPTENKKRKKGKESPEVKLGLKIEKLLEKSPSNTPKKGKNKKQAAPQNTPQPGPKTDFLHRLTVSNAVKALTNHVKSSSAEKKELLDDKTEYLIVINFFKIPTAVRGIVRVTLPHSLLNDTSDVCMLVSDLKQFKKDPEEVTDHYKQLLSKLNMGSIEVVPFRKLKTEYTQFEQQRKFINSYDKFLIDSKLGHRVHSVLRKTFFGRKLPVPTKLMPEKKMKSNIEVAMRKVPLMLKKTGLTISSNFGHSNMSLDHMVDNIMELTKVLSDNSIFTSGLTNIRSIVVKGPKTQSFPIFMATLSPNAIKVEAVKPKGPKSKPVTDELSTFVNTNVTVFPDGRVKTKKIKDMDDEDGGKKKNKKQPIEDDEDESDSDDETYDESKFNLILKGSDESDEDDDDDDDEDLSGDEESFMQDLKRIKSDKDDDESSSDEEEIEAAEQEFLKELRQHQNEVTKKGKGNKNAAKAEKEQVPKLVKATPEAKPAPLNKKQKGEQGKKENFSPKKNFKQKQGDQASPKNVKGGQFSPKNGPQKGGKKGKKSFSPKNKPSPKNNKPKGKGKF